VPGTDANPVPREVCEPERLPQGGHSVGTSGGDGYGYLQGILQEHSIKIKKMAMAHFGIKDVEIAKPEFVTCEGSRPVIRVWVACVAAFNLQPTVQVNFEAGTVIPWTGDSFQGNVVGPTKAPPGVIMYITPIFGNQIDDEVTQMLAEVELNPKDDDKWAGEHKDSIRVLDMMQRMPVLRVVGEDLVRDKTAQPPEEKKQSKQAKTVDGKAEKPM
jgi:hypothetical protein